MKTRAALLLLLALFALIPCALAAGSVPSPSSAPAPADADFLASLSGPGTSPTDLPPVPAFMTGCTSSAQCPSGQICCLACGYAGCERRACFATKTCPHFP